MAINARISDTRCVGLFLLMRMAQSRHEGILLTHDCLTSLFGRERIKTSPQSPISKFLTELQEVFPFSRVSRESHAGAELVLGPHRDIAPKTTLRVEGIPAPVGVASELGIKCTTQPFTEWLELRR